MLREHGVKCRTYTSVPADVVVTENASNLIDYTDPKNWKVEKFVGHNKVTGTINIKSSGGCVIRTRWIGFLENEDTLELILGIQCELN